MQSRGAGTFYIAFGNTTNWLSSGNWAVIDVSETQIRVRDGAAATQGPVSVIAGSNAKLMTRNNGTGAVGSSTNPLVVTWGNVLPNHTQIDSTGTTGGGVNILPANAVVTPTATITVNYSHAGNNNSGAGVYAGGRVVGLDAGVHPMGLVFQGWEVVDGTISINGANNRVAFIVLPEVPQNITVRANWGTASALTGNPSVTGDMQLGQTLTAGAGSLAPQPLGAITYQWQRASAANGTFTDISGATFATYVPTVNDIGNFIRVRAVTENTSGSAYSVPTVPVTALLGGSVEIPTNVSVNGVISVTNNLTPAGIGGLNYQWLISDNAGGPFTDITTNGNNETYTPTISDRNRFIRVRVSSDYASGYNMSVLSNVTNAVEDALELATSPVLINQIYGGGDQIGNAISRSFIELYNTSGSAYDLSGYSIQLANTFGGPRCNKRLGDSFLGRLHDRSEFVSSYCRKYRNAKRSASRYIRVGYRVGYGIQQSRFKRGIGNKQNAAFAGNYNQRVARNRKLCKRSKHHWRPQRYFEQHNGNAAANFQTKSGSPH